ncbi:hypothetical protein SAMN05216391_1236 [Lachnospiraceae bacterium KHCPX20]|nr:hypothetical protein SAMN05216391_1236 [Lachnospiraceae bacterium KHCPX20]
MVIDFLNSRKDELSSQINDLTSRRNVLLKEIREGEKFLALLKNEQVEPFSVFSPRRLDSPKIRQIEELEQKLIVLKEDEKELKIQIEGLQVEFDTVSSSYDEVSNLLQIEQDDARSVMFREHIGSGELNAILPQERTGTEEVHPITFQDTIGSGDMNAMLSQNESGSDEANAMSFRNENGSGDTNAMVFQSKVGSEEVPSFAFQDPVESGKVHPPVDEEKHRSEDVFLDLNTEVVSDIRAVTIRNHENDDASDLDARSLAEILKQLQEIDDLLPAEPMKAKLSIKNLTNRLMSR